MRVMRHDLADPGALSGATSTAEHWALTPTALVAAADDARSDGEVLTAHDGSRLVGYLPVWRYAAIASCSDVVQSAPDLIRLLGDRPVYVAGSYQQMAGGAVLDPTLTPAERLTVLTLLREHATCMLRAPLIVPFVTTDDPLTSCSPSTVLPGPTRFCLAPLASREEFLASLPRSRRSILSRDYRQLDRDGLQVAVGEADLDETHYALVSKVKQRHDVNEPPVLVRWRLSRWRKVVQRPTSWSVRDAAGELVAFAIGSHGACGRLEVYEVGVDYSHDAAHPAYIAAMLLGPLGTAWRTGRSMIGLGFDAGTPKRLRGAAEEDTVHLLFDEVAR